MSYDTRRQIPPALPYHGHSIVDHTLPYNVETEHIRVFTDQADIGCLGGGGGGMFDEGWCGLSSED